MKIVTKIFLFFVIAALGFFAIACGSKKVNNGEVNVFIWTEYIPESVIEAFQDETGIKVNLATYSSNEDMLSKVKASQTSVYDIAVPSDYMVKRMIAEGLLSELDGASLQNFSNLDASYLNRDFDPKNLYSVPFMAGVAAVVVNKTMVSEEITTFFQLLEPKYKNSIVVLDDYRAVIGAVAKSLGYSFNTTSPADLKRVDSAMALLKPNVKLRDSDSPKTAMLNGETSIGYMWAAEIAIAMQEKPDTFEVVFPKEGAYLFIDNFVILKNAKNFENAKRFIEFILRPEISAQISEQYPYVNPNKEALKLLPASYLDNPASNVPPEVFKNGEFIKDVGQSIEIYDDIWTKFTR
ncbi:MAG: spermidine/putrescine ABC transporter substrate-binding protein [Elusimicrobiota bacterium]|jgi:spermidine/putrescine-binding protein|nr:spermidine/putrescine ABC transporter substrate-binding protein [Elusimicrobiota bacterium]